MAAIPPMKWVLQKLPVTLFSRAGIVTSRRASTYSPVVKKIEQKKESALLGGGPKRIESQHKKVYVFTLDI